jgi:LPS export ABC transporter protein LptC
VVETGADGRPLYTLQAHEVRQDPDTQVTHLTTVHMTFRDSSGAEWQAHSDTAEVQQDSSKIDLSGSIDVWGLLGDNAQPAHILTDKLHVDTQTDIIRTTQPPVTLKWAGLMVEARTLVLNVKDHNVKLEGGVHGQLVP